MLAMRQKITARDETFPAFSPLPVSWQDALPGPSCRPPMWHLFAYSGAIFQSQKDLGAGSG